jgi:hypothetical protein
MLIYTSPYLSTWGFLRARVVKTLGVFKGETAHTMFGICLFARVTAARRENATPTGRWWSHTAPRKVRGSVYLGEMPETMRRGVKHAAEGNSPARRGGLFPAAEADAEWVEIDAKKVRVFPSWSRG